MKLTMVVYKGEEYFIGTIREIPAVLTQGITIEETKKNILDALNLYLEDMRSENFENQVLEEELVFG